MNAKLLREKAYALGFEFVGISKAEELTDEARKLEEWLNKGYHGQMAYMGNHFEKRIDPRKLVDGAKSVISLMYNYHNPEKQKDVDAPKISQYAYGEDYHQVLKKKLKILLDQISTEVGTINGRCFVDSAPVLERDWARRSGLGWMGKNTMIIHKQRGSYFFLAEIILDVEFEYDHPVKDHCGTCTKCIDACPTNAINEEGYFMDGSKCISYFTIELKDEIPSEMKGRFENWMFGCDICQQVCPWNRFSIPNQEPDFQPKYGLLEMEKDEWLELTQDVFSIIFKKSAVKRTKYSGLMRNIHFLEDS